MPRVLVTLLALALLVGAGTASTAGAASSETRLQASLTRALDADGLDRRRTAALVVDVRTGKVVFDRGSRLSLRPASAEKLAVALAALRILGPRYTFRTEVVGVGERRGKAWAGDLVLVGGGDPTLDLADIEALARRVRARGVRRVTGRVLGDDRHYDAQRDAPGWKPGFAGIESRPLSALSVEGARVAGLDASAASAARALTAALERRGVEVAGAARSGRAPEGAAVLASDTSAPLAAIVGHMNRESDNFYAELLLKELGATTTGLGSSEAGAQIVLDELRRAGVPVRGVRIVDGSGLSLDDRLTPAALVAILLEGASDETIRDAFIASLAVAGISGTMENRLGTRPTRGQVIAKTGTTNVASALAGFVRRRYVFAILQNGSPVPYWTARVAQDRFVTALAGAK
jgi:D-alanyl-D-alanine carboxypeptidase/D-alanyl-D-alanine-endopeptidase (penicillin-binding protein 4)